MTPLVSLSRSVVASDLEDCCDWPNCMCKECVDVFLRLRVVADSTPEIDIDFSFVMKWMQMSLTVFAYFLLLS